MGEVDGMSWTRGAVKEGKWLTCGCLCRGRVAPVLDANVSRPIHAFYLIPFSYKKLVRGHFPGLVTSGGNVSHKHFTEMRRLARDETPFLLAMPPRVTTLVW
jgi:hypothetical protein